LEFKDPLESLEHCACALDTSRSGLILFTVVLVAVFGFYITYRQILTFVFRHWLRFTTASSVWVLVDPSCPNRATCPNYVRSGDDECKTMDGTEKVHEEISDGSISVKIESDVTRIQPMNIEMDVAAQTGQINEICSLRSKQKFAETVALEEKAYVDGALLVVVRKDEDFKELIRSVEKHCHEKHSCNIMHGLMKSSNIMHELVKELLEKKRKSKQLREKLEIDFKVITQEIRNLLMNGTIKLSLSPNKNKENEKLILLLTGFWSGGAHAVDDVNLNGISVSASQHFQISYLDGKSVINSVHDFKPRSPIETKVKLQSNPEFRMV